MDQKEKDCAYWIAVLLAGVILGAAIGFVFAWSWHQRPGALSDVRILDVLVAIGTVGAAIGSVYSARMALRIAKEKRLEEHKQRLGEAISYMLERLDVLDMTIDFFDAIRSVYNGKERPQDLEIIATGVNEIPDLLGGIDLNKARLVSPNFQTEIKGLQQRVEKIKVSLESEGNYHYSIRSINAFDDSARRLKSELFRSVLKI